MQNTLSFSPFGAKTINSSIKPPPTHHLTFRKNDKAAVLRSKVDERISTLLRKREHISKEMSSIQNSMKTLNKPFMGSGVLPNC